MSKTNRIRGDIGFDVSLPMSVFWKQGVKGYLDHLNSSTNPYSSEVGPFNRQLWFDGYYDARRILKWGVADDADEEELAKAEYIRSVERGRR